MTTSKPGTAREDIVDLAKGSGFGLIGTILSQTSLFVVVAMLAAVRGTSGVGLYSESFAVYTLLTLLCLLGFQTTLTRYVAMHLVANEHSDIARVVRTGMITTAAASTVVAVGLFAGSHWLASQVLHESGLSTPLRLVAIAVIPSTYTKAAAAVIQGYNRLRDFSLVSLVVEPVARVILTAVAILATNRPILGAMVALVISNTISAIWAGRLLWRLIPRDTRPTDNYAIRPVMAFTALTWSATITTNGLIWADTLILGSLRSASEVGVYQVATRVVTLVTSAAVPIAQAFAPRITELLRRREWDRLSAAYKLSTTWTVRISLPFLAICALAPHEVLALFGNSFAVGASVTIILVVGKFVDTATGPCGMVLNMSRRVGTNAVLNVATLILNVLLNLWLIPTHGIVGAAIAWTVCLILLNLGRVLSVQYLLGLSPLSKSLAVSLLSAVPGVLVALALHTQLHGRLLLAADVVAIIGLYVVVTRLFAWSEEDTLVVRSVTPKFRGSSAATPTLLAPDPDAAPILATSETPSIRLDELISPLRYDIMLRASFMALIEEHRELADTDRKAFLRLAKAHPYYLWYCEIAWSLYPRARQMAPLDLHFRRRVDRSIELFDSFQRTGFNNRYPVTIRRVTDPALTASGKSISYRFLPVDGCHRLALLYNSGVRELTPDMYKLNTGAAGPLRDNTVRVLSFSPLSDAEYFAFIGRGYGVNSQTEVGLLRAVKRKGIDQAEEVRSIIDIDLPVLRDRTPGDAEPATELPQLHHETTLSAVKGA